MKSAIRRIAALTALTATAAVSAFTTVAPALASQFGKQEVDQNKFVAIAAPYRGGSAHQLLVLEQVSNSRACWSETPGTPTQVEPLLLNFDFTGICGRATDSNGYSIRVNDQDLGLQYSLRVVRRDGDMLLIGSPNNRNNPQLLIGSTSGVTPDFAKIDLEEGWRFTKRTFEGRALGHVYLTYEGELPPANVPTPTPGTPTTPPVTPTPTPTPGTPTPPVTPVPLPTPVTFGDTANDIYLTEIEQAVQLGFVAGFYEDNTFRPQQSLTREQLVSMVIEAIDRLPNVTLNVSTQVSGNPYPDVSASRWSAAKIQFARNNGLISGYQDGRFRPDQPVTRAEMMAVLRRAAIYGQQVQGQNAQLQPQQDPVVFSDTSAHWAGQTITEMSSYCGVASPLNERGTAFAPDQATQRNYAAAATLRMLNCVTEDDTATQATR